MSGVCVKYLRKIEYIGLLISLITNVTIRVTSHFYSLFIQHVTDTAHIMTDEFKSYCGLDKEFASHDTVQHGSGEYVRGIIHVNFAESYFSLLKRGIFGAYHHVSKQHLPRYLAEFDQRWNSRDISDGERAGKIIHSAGGKRLTYKSSGSESRECV